jgi:outer membrane protein
MKNLSLILNAVLLIAVGFLMVQHFSGSKKAGSSDEQSAPKDAPLNVVYVNADTLLTKYEYMNQKQEELSKREQEADTQLKSRGRALEKEFLAAQDKIQKGLLAPNQIAAEEQRLAQKQQTLMAEQERITRELMSEGQKIQEELNKAIKDLLAEIQKEKGYDYILSYGPGTGILMVNEKLDITPMVLERLNKKETQENKAQ